MLLRNFTFTVKISGVDYYPVSTIADTGANNCKYALPADDILPCKKDDPTFEDWMVQFEQMSKRNALLTRDRNGPLPAADNFNRDDENGKKTHAPWILGFQPKIELTPSTINNGALSSSSTPATRASTKVEQQVVGQ